MAVLSIFAVSIETRAAQSTPEAVHSLTNRLLWHQKPSAWARHRGRDTLTFTLEILFCFSFCYSFHSCNAALMSALHSYSYCQYSPPFVLCESNIQKLHNKFVLRKIPFNSSITCLDLCFKQLV